MSVFRVRSGCTSGDGRAATDTGYSSCAHSRLFEPLRHDPTGAFGGQPRSAGAPGGPPCHAPTGAFGGQQRSADAPGGPLRHAPSGAFGGQPRSAGRRDAFRRARRFSRRFNSVSRTPWRSRAPSCAATPFGERGDAQDGSTPCRGPPWRSRAPSCAATLSDERGDAQDGSTPCRGHRGAHGLLRAPRRLSASAAMLNGSTRHLFSLAS